jgi:hypothetical protein
MNPENAGQEPALPESSAPLAEQRWWSVRMLFEYVLPGQPSQDALYEEQVRLIRAGSEEEALQKAEKLGAAEFLAYENGLGEEVQVIFREVLDIVDIFEGELRDGAEVYYDFLDWSEVQQVRRQQQPFVD